MIEKRALKVKSHSHVLLRIVLSRGLDVYQRFEPNDAFSFANRMQQHRQCKEFDLTYVKIS